MKAKDPLHILYINHSSHVSGAEKCLNDLISHLDIDYFRSFYICPARGTFFRLFNAKANHVAFLPLPILRNTLNPLYWIFYFIQWVSNAFRVYSVIKKKRIDLIHANSLSAGMHSFLAAKRAKIKQIIHVRDIVTGRGGWIASRLLYIAADKIICVSQAVYDHYALENPKLAEKMCVVYDGMNHDAHVKRGSVGGINDVLSRYKNDILIGNIGQMIPLKGQIVLLNAILRLKEYYAYENLKFLFIGGTLDVTFHQSVSYQRRLERFIDEHGLTHDVIIIKDFVSDMSPIYNALHILVQPSIRPDSFPHTILEAFYHHVPVVASRIGGIPEQIQHGKTGLLFSPGSVHELAENIHWLLINPALKSDITQNAYALVNSRFSIDNHIQTITNLYRKLCR